MWYPLFPEASLGLAPAAPRRTHLCPVTATSTQTGPLHPQVQTYVHRLWVPLYICPSPPPPSQHGLMHWVSTATTAYKVLARKTCSGTSSPTGEGSPAGVVTGGGASARGFLGHLQPLHRQETFSLQLASASTPPSCSAKSASTLLRGLFPALRVGKYSRESMP